MATQQERAELYNRINMPKLYVKGQKRLSNYKIYYHFLDLIVDFYDLTVLKRLSFVSLHRLNRLNRK